MVALYVAGTQVGTLADAEELLTEFAAQQKEVELRGATGTYSAASFRQNHSVHGTLT